MTRLHTFAFALLAGALTSSVGSAQVTPPTPPASRPRQVAPRRQAAPPANAAQRGPAANPLDQHDGVVGQLLRARRQLELTDDQVKKLEAIAAAPRPEANRSEMLRAQADMMDAMKGDGNLAAARSALDKMSRLRNDQAIARLKEGQDVRGVLTATQKARLDKMRGMRRQMVARQERNGARGVGRARSGRGPQLRPGFDRAGRQFNSRFNRGGGRPDGPMGPPMMGRGGMGPGNQMGPGGQARPGTMDPNMMAPGMNPGSMQRGRRGQMGVPPDSVPVSQRARPARPPV